jgi:hypothetical protein
MDKEKRFDNEIERWHKKLWETKGCRFNASRRLEHRDKWSKICITAISIYILLINLLIVIPEIDKLIPVDWITYSTICLSIVVLAISLSIDSKNYKIRAGSYHECGRKVNKVYDDVCLLKNATLTVNEVSIREIQSDYYAILDRYENHSPIDFHKFRVQNINEYPHIKYKPIYEVWTNLKYYWSAFGIYFLIVSSPIIVFLFSL